MLKNILIFIALAAFSGCATYNEKPINLQEDTVAWEKVSRQFAGTLNFKAALKTGLVMNMDLNKMRAKYALSKDVEKEAGWWNDPSFSLGITRHYAPAWQTNLSADIGFTIPVTGLPGLEKEVAAHYREADYWTLVQMEIDFAENLENIFTEFAGTQLKRKLAQARLAELKDELKKMNALVKNGETSQAKCQLVNSRVSSTAAEFQELRSLEHTQKLALIKTIGLHPSLIDEIVFDFPPNTSVPKSVPVPPELALLALPRIRSQLSSYAASETELKTEIRKQYPELRLSPGFERDGDDDLTKMFSLGIGFDLPMWNRNRRAIAVAGGNREVKQLETIQLWREQLFEVRELEKQQAFAREHCAAEATRLETRMKNAELLTQSLAIGEADFPDISEARQEAYSVRLAFIDSLVELRKIQAKLRALNTQDNQDN